MTHDKVKKAFLDDLRALLAKWDADLDIVDDCGGYYARQKAEFSISSIYDSENDVELRPYTTISICRNFNKDSK